MITKLLKFLLIQITIQFALAANLEGRTSHYVNLLDSNTNDDTALRITCPVYTIKPANQTAKFTKYAAPSEQFTAASNSFEERTNAQTFKECATQAATDNAKMFMFDEGACTISHSLFTRLPETCGDESAVIVYMVEPLEDTCAHGYTYVNEGIIGEGVYCGSFGSLMKCTKGKIYGYDSVSDIVYLQAEEGCYSIQKSLFISYDEHKVGCTAQNKTTCTPADSDSRAEFVQTLKDIAVNRDSDSGITDFMVDCRYNSGANGFRWITDAGTIDQPENIAGEWKDGFPANQASAEYAYMTPEGLVNEGDQLSTHFCCYKADTVARRK